ncbi:MAG: hypothetical protein LBJ10_07160 [Clostridiales bacterium]|nr:hypothetical protein [Clostridiales bacterium]
MAAKYRKIAALSLPPCGERPRRKLQRDHAHGRIRGHAQCRFNAQTAANSRNITALPLPHRGEHSRRKLQRDHAHGRPYPGRLLKHRPRISARVA